VRRHTAARSIGLLLLLWTVLAGPAEAQGLKIEPVFSVQLVADREPVVAGESLRLAVVVTVDEGWHVNTDRPGDDFLFPSSVTWDLPEGWAEPAVTYAPGEELRFEFSDMPIAVWQGRVVLLATTLVPEDAAGEVRLVARVKAQACNDTECLPPLTVSGRRTLTVASGGSAWEARNQEVFAGAEQAAAGAGSPAKSGGWEQKLAGSALPLQILLAFLFGLLLNGTPCIFPLIPITIGFFAQQGEGRRGSTLLLALSYVLGMAVTYSALGVSAALAGQLFGAALQNPIVVLIIVAVVLALAASMFGAWELRPPTWATRVAGGRSGVLGALIMGLVVGLVAAPCLGPFVLGLLTYVGQVGSPFLGFVLFFALALGLGVPYLILGVATGSIQRLPASGMWMVGVKRFFGVLLVALAVFFLKPLIGAGIADPLLSAILILGGAYLLVVERTGHEQPTIDRMMRVLTAGLIVAGVVLLPTGGGTGDGEHLEWTAGDQAVMEAAVSSGGPVILDFYADWCAPCKELDEKTFADAMVAAELASFSRFKVDLTKADDATDALRAAYDVRGVPTVIVYSGGEEVFRITGFEPAERFLQRLP